MITHDPFAARPLITLTAAESLPIIVLVIVVLRDGIRLQRMAQGKRIEEFRVSLRDAQQNINTKFLSDAVLWILRISEVLVLPFELIMLRLYLAFPCLVRFLPDLTPAWCVLQIAIAFWLESSGSPKAALSALAISCGIAAFVIERSVSQMVVRGSRIVAFLKKAVPPSRVLVNAFVLMLSFGCIHWHVSKASPCAYTASSVSCDVLKSPVRTGIVTFSDAIYFSAVTMSTVGYGDIIPLSDRARLVCVLEMICGIVLLIVALNFHTAEWTDRYKVKP